MNNQETTGLCRYVRAMCPQQKFDEYTPDAWHDVLGDFPADEAKAAAAAIAKRQAFVAPGEIVTEIRRARRDRMQRDAETEAPPVDPDDVAAYQAALRQQRQDVARGDTPPRALTSGEIQQDDVTAMRQQGDLTAFLKQEIAAAPARNKHRRALVARYPDLLDRVLDLPGHKQWSGSVGRRQDVAAIVAEAEARAATEQQRRAA